MAYIVNTDNGQVIETPDNARIKRDVASKTGTGMACELGHCVTCIIKVVKGEEHLNKPDEREVRALEGANAPANARLLCRMRIAEEQTIEVQKFNRETDCVQRPLPPEKSDAQLEDRDDPFADLCPPECTSLIRKDVARYGVDARQ